MTDATRNTILNSAENGLITSKRISELGIYRAALTELVNSGDIIQSSRGIYIRADEWEDEYSLLQTKYARGIFSHATALYLHGYSERVPLTFHMTFPYGYNSPSIKKENVRLTRVVPENYELGITVLKTPYGNTVRAYDLERSLCDILRGADLDLQTVQYAMKKYVISKDRDINKLLAYAAKLHVEKKVRSYLEVLL